MQCGRVGVFSNVLMTLAASFAVTAWGGGGGGPEWGLCQRNVEKSELGLTWVARSFPQRRRPISPQAINTNNRHISPPSNLDEWPQENPRALCPVWSCTAHNYCTWKMCVIQLQCTLFYNLSVLWRLCSCVTDLLTVATECHSVGP